MREPPIGVFCVDFDPKPMSAVSDASASISFADFLGECELVKRAAVAVGEPKLDKPNGSFE